MKVNISISIPVEIAELLRSFPNASYLISELLTDYFNKNAENYEQKLKEFKQKHKEIVKNMKELLIFKATEKSNVKSPDFRLTAKVGEKFVTIGAGWNRKSAKGTPFISCLMAKPFKDLKGWHLEEDKNESQPELTPQEKEKVVEEEFIAM